jgi:hypothetical protein
MNSLTASRKCLSCLNKKSLDDFLPTTGGRSRTCLSCLEHRLGFDQTQYKRCCTCGEIKRKLNFYPRSRGGLDSECKPCKISRTSVWRRNLPPKRRWKHNLSRWHLSEEDYNQMLSTQNGACAVCLIVPPNGRLYIDHDHNCCPGNNSCGKCIRGLLCCRCNAGEGFVRDQEWLCRMTEYITQKSSHGGGGQGRR